MSSSVSNGAIRVSASPSLAPLLDQHGLCLLITTYDAGRLIVVSCVDGALDILFVDLGRTMGLAGDQSRLAIGTSDRILELHNVPAMCPELPRTTPEATGNDACYTPRNMHVTGDIDIHDIAWGGGDLWFVNTRFSCLCTLARPYSFVPRWRPPFTRGLSPDDRCHLNGLAMLGSVPGYVTALAASDDPEGWRPLRAAGGIVMEVASGEIIARGLSMPHSPRLVRDELFVLNSGEGSLERIDRRTGARQAIAQFSGFTRGLHIHDQLAFVGLSKVRESLSFGGLPLTNRLPEHERFCGVQVMNLHTGALAAMLKFESGVQDIFAVTAIPGVRFPAVLKEDDPLVPDAFTLPAAALAQLR